MPDDSPPDDSRRNFLKIASGAAATGALGTLAGCTGGDGGDGGGGSGGDGGSGDGGDGGSGGDGGDGGDGGGGQETVELTHWTSFGALSNKTREFWPKSAKTFESNHDNVELSLNFVGFDGRNQKLSSAANAKNLPDSAESGSLGIEFFNNDLAPDHASYIEETEGLPDDWVQANTDTALYRGSYWSGGSAGPTPNLLGLNPKFFRERAGISDPASELNTWTKWRKALETVDSEYDVWAYEETGSISDLENAWSQAQTAYQGEDPFLRGDPDNLEIQVGNGGPTDGMLRNTVDMAKTFSSPRAASGGTSQIRTQLMNGNIASFGDASGAFTAYPGEAKFGWDGNVFLMPYPELDPEYGNEYGFDTLSGTQGMHGGFMWAFSTTKQIYNGSDNPDMAWNVIDHFNHNPDHIVPAFSEVYPHLAATPGLNQQVSDKLKEIHGEVPQPMDAGIKAVDQYGKNYNATGAKWDIPSTSEILFQSINKNLSNSIAGQVSMDELPGMIQSDMQNALSS